VFLASRKRLISTAATSFERRLVDRSKRLQKKAKAVRFEDYLDDAAPGHIGTLRRKFKAEDQRSRLKKEVLLLAFDK